MNEFYILPKKHHYSHHFVLFLYDSLVLMLTRGKENKSFVSTFNLKDDISLQNIFDEEKLDFKKLKQYLLENNMEEKYLEMRVQLQMENLLGKGIEYLISSFRASEKGRFGVMYSLLRLPFKDLLYHLEYIISRPLEYFHSLDTDEDFNRLDFNNHLHRHELNLKKEVIVETEAIIGKFFSSEEMYKIRYDKKCDYGLEQLWQKANHLITRHEPYRNKTGSLNFYGMSSEEVEFYWDKYYTTLPILMVYLSDVYIYLYDKYCDFGYKDNVEMKRKFVHLIGLNSSLGLNKNISYNELLEGDLYITCKDKDCSCSMKVDDEIIGLWEKSPFILFDCGRTGDLFMVESFDIEKYEEN